jgi:hypothetical protein
MKSDWNVLFKAKKFVDLKNGSENFDCRSCDGIHIDGAH